MNGCFNRQQFRDWHMAQDGYTSSRPDADTQLPRMVKVPHVMTAECQYTKHTLTTRSARDVSTGNDSRRNQRPMCD